MVTLSAFRFFSVLFIGALIADAVLRHEERVNSYYLVRKGVEGLLFVDFDGDGKPEHMFVSMPRGSIGSLHVVSHAGRQLLEIPFSNTDNSLRTHVAVNNVVTYESAYPWTAHTTYRLVVLQPTDFDLREEVYAYRDGQLGLTQAIPSDQPIIKALRTEDERGTYLPWSLYTFMRLPILLLVGCLALAAARLVALPDRART